METSKVPIRVSEVLPSSVQMYNFFFLQTFTGLLAGSSHYFRHQECSSALLNNVEVRLYHGQETFLWIIYLTRAFPHYMLEPSRDFWMF